MGLTVELTPEVHARLAREAQARGLALEAYVRTLLEHAGLPDSVTAAELEEFRAMLDSLAQDSAAIPLLSSEHFRRESIYQDHD
jgi:hypothetical protein